MPLPTPFVVKNGSKSRVFVSASMPRPVSLIVNVTNEPACTSLPRRDASSGETSEFAVSIDSVPPPGIASRALTTRLMITCSSCPGSACTRARSEP